MIYPMNTLLIAQVAETLRREFRYDLIEHVKLPSGGGSGGEKEFNTLLPCLLRIGGRKANDHDFSLQLNDKEILLEMKKNQFKLHKGIWWGGFTTDIYKMKDIRDNLLLLLVGAHPDWTVKWVGIAPMSRIRDELLANASDVNSYEYKCGWLQSNIDFMFEAHKKHRRFMCKADAYTILPMFEKYVAQHDPEFHIIYKIS
jgi:hypothetical protein